MELEDYPGSAGRRRLISTGSRPRPDAYLEAAVAGDGLPHRGTQCGHAVGWRVGQRASSRLDGGVSDMRGGAKSGSPSVRSTISWPEAPSSAARRAMARMGEPPARATGDEVLVLDMAARPNCTAAHYLRWQSRTNAEFCHRRRFCLIEAVTTASAIAWANR